MQRQFLYLFIIVIALFAVTDAQAQCSMCRAVVESSDEADLAAGVNNGILYLMGFPYLLLIGVGIILFRKARKYLAAPVA